MPPGVTRPNSPPQNEGKIPGSQPVLTSGNEMVVDTDPRVVAEHDNSEWQNPNAAYDQNAVVAACQRGDTEAYHALFEAHKDKVYSIALRYAGDPATAMDIAQDTFVKLMSRIQQYRWESSFDAWLYRLVVNSCMDFRRRQRRWLPLIGEMVDSFRAPPETALSGLLEGEAKAKIQDCISKLVPEQRIVVVLRYTEDLSYEEIAEVLGCSKGTVASRLNRAHKALERRLRHAK
ncbi:MAG: sigma-70 family RNA polymerase sigma factor [Acidobacteriota bacterium]